MICCCSSERKKCLFFKEENTSLDSSNVNNESFILNLINNIARATKIFVSSLWLEFTDFFLASNLVRSL